MAANFDVINRQQEPQLLMNPFQDLAADNPGSHVWLVGHHDQKETCVPQAPDRLSDTGQQLEFFQRGGSVRPAFPYRRPIENAVPVEKDRAFHT